MSKLHGSCYIDYYVFDSYLTPPHVHCILCQVQAVNLHEVYACTLTGASVSKLTFV